MKRSSGKVSRTGYFKVSEVARIVGVSASTVRTWEKSGLISPDRSDTRYRLFTTDDINRLKKIKFFRSAKNLNVSLGRHGRSHNGLARSRAAAGIVPASEPIGEKLRDLRLRQNMTLKDVAVRTGLSIGFLSSLERSKTSASIATLQKLAALYNTNFLSFFDGSELASKVVRPAERKVLETQPGTRIELLALGQTLMESQLWRIAPGASSGGAYSHEGEEFIFVLSGRFEIWLDATEHYILRKGDSLYFPSSQSHRWINPGKTETRLLWINTPPTF